VPVKTFTAPGTFPVTLTVRDEWNVPSAVFTFNVTITEPVGNVAPVPVFSTSCIALACGTSSAGTLDANVGDVITYSWNWGDATLPTTGATGSHSYLVPGTYTITLTTTDGWLKSASTTHTVVLTEPAGNVAPIATFTTSCTALACQTNSVGTGDPNGDVIRYSWNFGDASALSTAASPAHTYALAGTYTITLTVTDGWNRFTTVSNTVTMTEPAGNHPPVAAFSTSCTSLTCLMDSTGTSDPDGDAISYSWNFGDLTAAVTTAAPSHSYAVGGTFTVTLTVKGRVGQVHDRHAPRDGGSLAEGAAGLHGRRLCPVTERGADDSRPHPVLLCTCASSGAPGSLARLGIFRRAGRRPRSPVVKIVKSVLRMPRALGTESVHGISDHEWGGRPYGSDAR
jgi:PKD repeat protein